MLRSAQAGGAGVQTTLGNVGNGKGEEADGGNAGLFFLGSASRLARLLGSDWFLLLGRKTSLIKLTFRSKREGSQIYPAFLEQSLLVISEFGKRKL